MLGGSWIFIVTSDSIFVMFLVCIPDGSDFVDILSFLISSHYGYLVHFITNAVMNI